MVSFCILPLLSICRDKLNCMKVSGRFADQYSAPEPFVGSIRSRCTRHCFLLQNFLFVNIDTVNIDNIDASGHCQDSLLIRIVLLQMLLWSLILCWLASKGDQVPGPDHTWDSDKEPRWPDSKPCGGHTLKVSPSAGRRHLALRMRSL